MGRGGSFGHDKSHCRHSFPMAETRVPAPLCALQALRSLRRGQGETQLGYTLGFGQHRERSGSTLYETLQIRGSSQNREPQKPIGGKRLCFPLNPNLEGVPKTKHAKSCFRVLRQPKSGDLPNWEVASLQDLDTLPYQQNF